MKGQILSYVFALIVSTIILSANGLAQQIGISLGGSNNYVIPPGQTTNNIRFDVSASGLTNQNIYYGWNWRLNGGNWSNVIYIGFGFGSGNYSSWLAYDLGEGTHTVDVQLLWYESPPDLWRIITSASRSATLIKQYSITVQNSFGGGIVKVDGNEVSSGSSFTWNSGTTHTAEAIDGQSSGGYVQRYRDWTTPSGTATSQPVQIYVDGNRTYTANFAKEFNISFQNSLPGAGNGGVIKVNGVQYSSPTSTFPVLEGNTISGEAVYQVIDGIEYTFALWSSGSSPFSPTDHTTYTANYNAKPLPPPNVSAGGAVDEPVQITWCEHPHTSVTQYQIWRIIKPLGQGQGSPEQIATVSRGTTSFTDYGCVVTAGYTHDLVSYDVRSYFSVNSSTSDPSYVAVYANSNPAKSVQDQTKVKEDLPSEVAISNYPNPFNPSTTFSYQLIEQADVHLQIFDLLGRQVAELVNSMKSAGFHSVIWNGRDGSGKDAPTGMYLYRFYASSADGKEVFRKTGKLLLTK